MEEPRQSSYGTRGLAPPPALCGFLLLLALAFGVSHAVGVQAGPVAPGMHATSTSSGGDGGGGADMGDMRNMGHGNGR
ncbi:hypothetical protein [Streptomyces botrytidirepellens]|uniref:Secreted protein n=1 Tax=Streptomyces botrytidirepellens TaxID=2486417 RepID=A0A3M8WWY6_9ACTN|nr:hypothetical protein [Streptomyces botrytidirepellens]RNG34692.1 hypothetical protein EEJ42_04960 [Streptomyces botrytidirepellens]